MAIPCQLSSVGKEFSCPGKHMKKLKLYEAIGPARDAWATLNDKVTKYANDHHEEITRGVKRPEGYAISFFMVGSEPSTARATILISSLNKSERRAAKRVVESLEALAVYPGIAVKCVDARIAMLYADGDLPYDVPRNPAHELFIEGGITLCGARIVAGSSVATLGGAIYLDDGKTITPFGLTVFHAGSGVEQAHDIQPDDDVLEFAFDESSDEDEDEDLFENRSRSISMSQTDADTDETTISRTLTESVDLEPKLDAEDSPQESILPLPNTTGDSEETSKGRPPNGLDYQLVSLAGIVYAKNMLQIPLQAPIQPRFVAKEAKDVEVWAATSTTPPVRGRLSISPYLLKFPTYSLQKLWVVDLERDIRLGDSGAWIIDEASNVYGHIVAATPGSFRAYILPLHQIFEDIEVFTKCKPSLLSPSEIVSEATGGIARHTRIIQYGGDEEIPSGNESEKSEEPPTRNLQNDAQKKRWINVPDTPSEILNTAKLAKENNPALERTLACPYLKKDPIAHHGCSNYRLSRIRDVRQHIYRRHTPNFYCQRCHNTDFQDNQSLQSHIIAGTCHREHSVAPFLSLHQQRQLSRKSNPRLSEEDKWFAIWKILFVTAQQPLSAYIDTSLTGDMRGFREYCLARGPAALTEQIESNPAWLSTNITTEQRQMYLNSVIARGINSLFEDFTQSIPSPNSIVGNRRASSSQQRSHNLQKKLGATSTSSIADSGVALGSQFSSSAATSRRGSLDLPHGIRMFNYQMATATNEVEHTSTTQEPIAEPKRIEGQNLLESEALLNPYFDYPPFNAEWLPSSDSSPDFDSACFPEFESIVAPRIDEAKEG